MLRLTELANNFTFDELRVCLSRKSQLPSLLKMPCSRCRLVGHNARNRRCPGLYQGFIESSDFERNEVSGRGIAERNPEPEPPQHFSNSASDVQPNSSRARAVPPQVPPVAVDSPALSRLLPEIRPRGFVSRRRPSYALLEFIRMFENMRPRFSTGVVSDGAELLYHCYELPRNLIENPVINHGILRHYIHPITRNVQICKINQFSISGLVVRLPNNGVRILSNESYPIHQSVYLMIPQLPGITIGENEMDRWVSVQSAVPAFLASQRPRLASSYVKEWKIILDVSQNVENKLDDVCMICLDEKSAMKFAKTNCGHEYCVDCMKMHVNANKHKTVQIVCPMCRTQLSEIVLYDVDTHSNLQEFILVV